MAPSLTAMAMQSKCGEESYEKNSGFQNLCFHSVGKPVLEQAIQQLLCNIAARPADQSAFSRKHITVADFGCSYGRNTLDYAEVILGALHRHWADEQTCPSTVVDEEKMMPEIQYFFLDLPSNDFNSLFQSLQPYLHHPPHCNSATAARSAHANLPKIFAAGVPGSFHGRLLPSASLDLAVSSFSLHWLSQVPPSLLDKSSPAWNGGQPWILNVPQGVADAYISQSRMDVTNFLKSRAQELASGGVLFLLLGGPANLSKNGSIEVDYPPRWEYFTRAWKELVKEGIITLEEFETFNMPMYFFDEHHLKNILTNVPEFKLLHIEGTIENVRKVKFTLSEWMQTIISVTKPTVESHLGTKKSKELFKKLDNIISENHGLMVDNVPHKVLAASLQRL